MPFYQESRTMKGAVIGTIMPWSGSLSEVPKGWIICDGSQPEAKDYPLLVQAIGDTYNGGTSNLGGAFPAYTGNFVLPNLVDGRILMDIEQSYFQATGRIDPIDQDADAGNLVGPYIGENIDNGVPEVFNDVSTDVVFTLNDRTGYTGKISGNTIIDGQGAKDVFIGGRKLGHGHIRTHSHSGSYETLAELSRNRPGRGVIPYSNIEAHFTYANYDQATNAIGSDGIRDYARFSLGWKKDGTDLVSFTDNPALLNIDNGFGTGFAGRTLAKVRSENPPVNLYAQNVSETPIANFAEFDYRIWAGGGSIQYGPGGQAFGVPDGYRNDYPDVPSVGYFTTFVSNIGNSWQDDTIQAHAHDPFQVVYDQNSLKPQSRLQSEVNIPITTELDNVTNTAALQISMNTSQPSLTCIYIIRAY